MKTCASVHFTVLATIDSQKTKKQQTVIWLHSHQTKKNTTFPFVENETNPWFVLFSNFSST